MQTETQTFRGVTIAVITDLHAGNAVPGTPRRGDLAVILLKRTVQRLNRRVKPDITLILGDLLEDGTSPDAVDRLIEIRNILDALTSPYVILPGNHDCSQELFYAVFERPEDSVECKGARFIAFLDKEEPGYHASRSRKDLNRLHAARQDFNGPLISLQHVSLFPVDKSDAPYNYTNSEEVVTAMKSAGVTLSISGHYHAGIETLYDGRVTYIHAPAMCEAPFPYTIITLENDTVVRRTEPLAMDPGYHFIDTHVHTQLAYCNATMEVEKTIALAHDFGLAGLVFTEHTGHLYVTREEYRKKICFEQGLKYAKPRECRMSEYLSFQNRFQDSYAAFGFEADSDYQGFLLLRPEDREKAGNPLVLGAMHSLPKDRVTAEYFLAVLRPLLKQNIFALAHPFRVFRREGVPIPRELFLPVARLLQENQVAAEINVHTNEPPVEFLKICLELGVLFTFGSDAHDLSELGDFYYQIQLLTEAGYDGDFSDILAPVPLHVNYQ